MSVKVEEEWKYKKVKSETASKSAFAHKINKKLKGNSKISYGYRTNGALSREVIVKITGGAWSKKGIKNAVEYISKEWQEEIIDSNGVKYKSKEEMEIAISILQGNVVANVKADPTKEVKLTHNIIFSAPRIAGVKKEDALEAVRKVLKEKYPDNYFVMAYHDETENPHVHVVLNIHKSTGKRIDIKNKAFHEIRRSFCNKLVEYGYDVKASRRYKLRTKEYDDLTIRDNRNVYEVVDFGTESYQLDKKNSKNNYLTYRVKNSNKEVRIWGKEIIDAITRNGIKKGDLVNIEKTGEEKVKVPIYGKDGKTIISWKDAKRNQWKIEKINSDSIKVKQGYQKEIKLDTPQQIEEQSMQKQKFEVKNIKATKKYESKTKKQEGASPRKNRNICEVVGFGTESYKLNEKNRQNNYLTYRKENSDKEITIWGLEILDAITKSGAKKGDLINIEKTGEVDVQIPVYGEDGSITSWKDAKRNKWNIEKINDDSTKIEQKYPKEIKLDTPQQAEKQLAQKQKFEHEKKLYLDPSYKEKFELEQKIQQKKKFLLNF